MSEVISDSGEHFPVQKRRIEPAHETVPTQDEVISPDLFVDENIEQVANNQDEYTQDNTLPKHARNVSEHDIALNGLSDSSSFMRLKRVRSLVSSKFNDSVDAQLSRLSRSPIVVKTKEHAVPLASAIATDVKKKPIATTVSFAAVVGTQVLDKLRYPFVWLSKSATSTLSKGGLEFWDGLDNSILAGTKAGAIYTVAYTAIALSMSSAARTMAETRSTFLKKYPRLMDINKKVFDIDSHIDKSRFRPEVDENKSKLSQKLANANQYSKHIVKSLHPKKSVKGVGKFLNRSLYSLSYGTFGEAGVNAVENRSFSRSTFNEFKTALAGGMLIVPTVIGLDAITDWSIKNNHILAAERIEKNLTSQGNWLSLAIIMGILNIKSKSKNDGVAPPRIVQEGAEFGGKWLYSTATFMGGVAVGKLLQHGFDVNPWVSTGIGTASVMASEYPVSRKSAKFFDELTDDKDSTDKPSVQSEANNSIKSKVKSTTSKIIKESVSLLYTAFNGAASAPKIDQSLGNKLSRKRTAIQASVWAAAAGLWMAPTGFASATGNIAQERLEAFADDPNTYNKILWALIGGPLLAANIVQYVRNKPSKKSSEA